MKAQLKSIRDSLLIASLKKAAKEQGLTALMDRLRQIVPDITEQYTNFKVDNQYLETKVRCLHAFQVSLLGYIIKKFALPTIVDIGDSSGTHLKYIKELYSQSAKGLKCLSVNLDAQAVQRIRKQGLDAIQARAEDIVDHNVNADIFLCFETLEHLTDPVRFLNSLSCKTKAKYLILTIPYLERSRVGLHHIRNNSHQSVRAENTHVLELNPADWKLIIQHAGWRIVKEKRYLQYPGKSLLYFTKTYWKKFDFEGFLGLVLEKDNTWSSRYLDW